MKKLGLIVAAAAMIATVSATVVSAKGWVQQGADWYYVDGSGEYVTDSIQTSGTNKFYLGEDGQMMKDYFLEDKDSNSYYFGSNGAMVTNTWVAIDSSIVENQGDYVPDTYWYYFQSSGKAMKSGAASVKKTTIDGKKVAFNEYGQMLTGWFTKEGKVINPDDETNPYESALYYAGGDNDGVLRSGWVTYYDGVDEPEAWLEDKTNLYFYFNPTNNKKTGNDDDGAKTKKINGKTYAFSKQGIMLSGWDSVNENGNTEVQETSSLKDKTTYFSGEDDGHQVKKGWVYAVPAKSIDGSAYDDSEEKYMYFGSSGDITRNQFKKINGKYYAFNYTGIMKTGLVIWAPDGFKRAEAYQVASDSNCNFIATADLDYAEGSDLTKKGLIRTDADKNCDYIMLDPDGIIRKAGGNVSKYWETPSAVIGTVKAKLHFFGDDGARKTGSNTINFTDDAYTFQSTASGNKDTGAFSKKYYVMGVLLKANQDIRYGIYNDATWTDIAQTGEPLGPQGVKTNTNVFEQKFSENLQNGNYLVLTTSGSKQKGNKAAKKDADGNYWFIDPDDGYLKGIWSVNVKWQDAKDWSTKEYTLANNQDSVTDVVAWSDLYVANANSNLPTTASEKKSSDGKKGWYEISNYQGMWFQSDYGDKSNQWLPFGVLDNSNKTCSMTVYDSSNSLGTAAHAYQVTPNDDYFLNCYWVD